MTADVVVHFETTVGHRPHQVDPPSWAVVLVTIAAVFYLVSRAAKRWWVGFAVATLPFLVTLYFFYQNVNRLLPPNL